MDFLKERIKFLEQHATKQNKDFKIINNVYYEYESGTTTEIRTFYEIKLDNITAIIECAEMPQSQYYNSFQNVGYYTPSIAHKNRSELWTHCVSAQWFRRDVSSEKQLTKLLNEVAKKANTLNEFVNYHEKLKSMFGKSIGDTQDVFDVLQRQLEVGDLVVCHSFGYYRFMVVLETRPSKAVLGYITPSNPNELKLKTVSYDYLFISTDYPVDYLRTLQLNPNTPTMVSA